MLMRLYACVTVVIKATTSNAGLSRNAASARALSLPPLQLMTMGSGRFILQYRHAPYRAVSLRCPFPEPRLVHVSRRSALLVVASLVAAAPVRAQDSLPRRLVPV